MPVNFKKKTKIAKIAHPGLAHLPMSALYEDKLVISADTTLTLPAMSLLKHNHTLNWLEIKNFPKLYIHGREIALCLISHNHSLINEVCKKIRTLFFSNKNLPWRSFLYLQ